MTHITKIPVVFEDRILLDGRLTMRVPKDFEQVPDDVVKQMFLMESKPQFVFELPYLSFGLTFTLTEIQCDEVRLEQMFPYMVRVFKTVGPNVRILSTGKKLIHGIYMRWFEAIAQTITEPSYSIIPFLYDDKYAYAYKIEPNSEGGSSAVHLTEDNPTVVIFNYNSGAKEIDVHRNLCLNDCIAHCLGYAQIYSLPNIIALDSETINIRVRRMLWGTFVPVESVKSDIY